MKQNKSNAVPYENHLHQTAHILDERSHRGNQVVSIDGVKYFMPYLHFVILHSVKKMRKQNKWWQIFGWCGLYLFWIMVFQKREFAFSQTATIEFCYLIFIAANYYFNILFAIPRFLYTKKYFAFVFLALAGIAVAALLRVPLAMYLNQHHFSVGKTQPGFSYLFTSSLLNIFVWVVFLLAIKLVMDRFHFQQYVDEMAKQKEQAELDFLNAQFNPHFLFNSLNSIYGHIDKHNTTARNMLLTFSDMLRYQLYDCNSNTIAIEKEMSYIKNYVALQKARMEDHLLVHLSIAENVKGFSVAPLLFIAFIENAFKYVGSSDAIQNEIRISVHKDAAILYFKCSNTKEENFENNLEHKGIGLKNAKRRLALIYPGKHELNIIDNKNYFEINLNIRIA